MDWVKQVQVIHSSYCGANLLCCLSVKDISVGFWFGLGFFCTFLLCVSSSFCSDDAVSSEGG